MWCEADGSAGGTAASASLLEVGERLLQSGAWRWQIATDTLQCTRGWQCIHGCSVAPASLAELEATVVSEDLPAFRAQLQKAIASGKVGTIRYRIVRQADQRERHVVSRLQLVRSPLDGLPQLVGSIRDITDAEYGDDGQPQREVAAAAVAERPRQRPGAHDEAEAAGSAQSSFLASMSHEIRTPLTTIVGLVELMRRDDLPAKQKQRLEQMNEAAQHLLSLITGVLELAKIQSGKLILNETTLDLARIVANVIEMTQGQARRKGLRLRADVQPLPGPLIGDPGRIRQAMLNYANSAIRMTDHGCIMLHLRAATEDPGSVLLRFEATAGIEISTAAAGRFFQECDVAGKSLPDAAAGARLGLAIVRQIAERMGGEAGIENAAGAGSTFWFTLRLRRTTRGRSPETPAVVPAEAAGTADRRRSASRVLIVDDQRANSDLIRAMLESVDLPADFARSGEEAVALAAASRYALILMDLQLPQIDGLEAARQIRLLPSYATVPIIALSGNVLGDVVDQCRRAGINDFIGKPFAMDALLDAVTRWLRSSLAP